MASNTNDAQNYYFSGQGVVMIGSRDASGNPTGLRPLGNVSDLKISVATTVVDHKGSQDGQRAVDARIQTETKPSISITIENWIAANLAAALRGGATQIAAGTVTTESVNCYPGLVSGLQYINLVAGSLVLTGAGSVTLTPYLNDQTPYDYSVNEAAGSVHMNDGSVVGFGALGTAATAVAVGSTTAITVTNTAAIGDSVALGGFTGADAALLNGKVAVVTAASGTAISVNINTTGKTITVGTNKVVFLKSVQPCTAAYGYLAQQLTDALTQPLNSLWLRFEGLNTAEGNDPVIVDVFKMSTDPLKELALISDTFGQFVLEGELLADGTKSVGSKYFRVKTIGG